MLLAGAKLATNEVSLQPVDYIDPIVCCLPVEGFHKEAEEIEELH